MTNYAADSAFIIRLENTENERTYENVSGTEYTLVDDDYNGYIRFNYLSILYGT